MKIYTLMISVAVVLSPVANALDAKTCTSRLVGTWSSTVIHSKISFLTVLDLKADGGFSYSDGKGTPNHPVDLKLTASGVWASGPATGAKGDCSIVLTAKNETPQPMDISFDGNDTFHLLAGEKNTFNR